jgi:hypothetical protein
MYVIALCRLPLYSMMMMMMMMTTMMVMIVAKSSRRRHFRASIDEMEAAFLPLRE